MEDKHLEAFKAIYDLGMHDAIKQRDQEREHLIKIILRNTETALMLLEDYSIRLREDGYGYVLEMIPIKGGFTEFYTLSKEVYMGLKEQRLSK